MFTLSDNFSVPMLWSDAIDGQWMVIGCTHIDTVGMVLTGIWQAACGLGEYWKDTEDGGDR